MAQALAALDSILADFPTAAPAATNGTPAAATNGTAAAAAKPKKQQQQQQAKAKSEPAPAAAAPAAPAAPTLDPAQQAELDRKYALVRSVGEECVTEPELRNLLLKKPNFVLYDGFEPSGRMHIAQGIFKAMNVNKCTAAGGTFVFWVADWFALMNDKMGGDLERIKTVGHYLIHVWTAAGMDMTRVQFKWSSDEICKNALPYWTQALDIARKFTVRPACPHALFGLADELARRAAACSPAPPSPRRRATLATPTPTAAQVARIKKCCQIMGRQEGTLTAAQILYPIMQCTDIFFLKADICQLGVDQRKVRPFPRNASTCVRACPAPPPPPHPPTLHSPHPTPPTLTHPLSPLPPCTLRRLAKASPSAHTVSLAWPTPSPRRLIAVLPLPSQVNMLAREYCDAAGIKLKPIILSHHMLYGLAKGQQKMSKSNKDSAIFMEDTVEDVQRKMTNAYCPIKEGEVEEKPEEESMQLTEDKLKNPCLDYVQHIIFSTETATFAAAGTTFTSFGAVRDAFLGGKLSEADLKAGLIAAVNSLLQPVRSHFETDADAKHVLAQITEWMNEPKGERKTVLRRLSVDAAAGACVVFAPPPSLKPTLASALDTLRCLAAAPAATPKLLWLADWSAFCLNCVTGGKKFVDDLEGIRAAQTLFVGTLTAIAPALMATVTVMRQSDAILSNPSDYWISVINVGRAFQLQKVADAVGNLVDAGQVVAALMHVADMLALGASAASVAHTPEQRSLLQLALDYFGGASCVDAGLKPPTLLAVEAPSLTLKAADAPPDVDGKGDGELFLLDASPDAQKKVKKSFCEPGNAADCPPLVLAKEVVLAHGNPATLTCGDKTYGTACASFAELKDAFASGALHPSELKPAVNKAVDAVLERVRKAVAADPKLKDAEKEMAKVHKRMTAKK